MSEIQNVFNQMSSDLYKKYGNVWLDQYGNSLIKDMTSFTSDVSDIQNTICKMIHDAGILQVSVSRKDRLYGRDSPAFLTPIDGAIQTEIWNHMAGMDETRFAKGIDYWKPFCTITVLSTIVMKVNCILQERDAQKKRDDEAKKKLEEYKENIRKQIQERELIRKQNLELKHIRQENIAKKKLEQKQLEQKQQEELEKQKEQQQLEQQQQIDLLKQHLQLQQQQNDILRQQLELQQKQLDLQQRANSTSIFRRIFS